MAVVSCANFQSGLFNVYGAVAESDADFVVHLGDYIYEYEAGVMDLQELIARTSQLEKLFHFKIIGNVTANTGVISNCKKHIS